MSLPDPYADWKGWEAGEFGKFSDYDVRYFGWHLRRALPRAAVALQVLEVGYGNGRFMGWLRQQGHTVTGIEANPRLVALARAAGYAAEADLAQLPAQPRFDLVAAFDVLEHVPVPQLQGFVEQLLALLAPDGRILLRFPNGESPFGLWMQHGDLTHVHALGLSKMRQLCAACGLHLEHAGETLPWREQPRRRRWGAALSHWSRRSFEWRLRKMYQLPRGLDLSPNQLVVLSRAAGPAAR